MAGILMGVILLGWAALEAARALLGLAGLAAPWQRRLLVPAAVWLVGSLLLLAWVPGTQLLEQGHRQALLGSLALLALVCAVSPLVHAWQRWAQQTVNTRNSS